MDPASSFAEGRATCIDPVLFPPRIVAGMRPAAKVTLLDYYGPVGQLIDLHHQYPGQAFVVIADYQGLSRDAQSGSLHSAALILAATYLAVGLDPQKAILYRQSDVPEILELAWIAFCLTRMESTEPAGNPRVAAVAAIDQGATVGMFLAAANILSVRGTLVPILPNQQNEIAMAGNIARTFNSICKRDLFPIPDPQSMVLSEVQPLENVAPVDATRFVTECTPLDSFGTLLNSTRALPSMADPSFATMLATQIYNSDFRRAFQDLIRSQKESGQVEEILRDGAIRARAEAGETLEEVKAMIGL